MMVELAKEYRLGAAALKERVSTLRVYLRETQMCEMERMRLRARIATLGTMCREMNEAAVCMERYYDRRYRRNERFTI
jgi:hypothetical protein